MLIKYKNFLEKIKVKAHKISSMDNNNTNLIKHVAKFNKPIFFYGSQKSSGIMSGNTSFQKNGKGP